MILIVLKKPVTNLAGGYKRAILDTSFDQVTSPNRVVPAKRSNTEHEPGSSNPADNTLVTYSVLTLLSKVCLTDLNVNWMQNSIPYLPA